MVLGAHRRWEMPSTNGVDTSIVATAATATVQASHATLCIHGAALISLASLGVMGSARKAAKATGLCMPDSSLVFSTRASSLKEASHENIQAVRPRQRSPCSHTVLINSWHGHGWGKEGAGWPHCRLWKGFTAALGP